MDTDLTDSGWQAFMGKALGLNISETGLLIDDDPQLNFAKWAWPTSTQPAKPASSTEE